MFVFQLGISIVQPRHRVYFLNDFINESGKSTWFLKSRKVKVCEWVTDSLWPCFYYFFSMQVWCRFHSHFPTRKRVRWSQDLVCFGPAFTHPRMHHRDVTPALPCLSPNEFLTSFFSNYQRGFYPLIYHLILSFNLSPVLVIKPKYPHSLYMVVAVPLCRYLFVDISAVHPSIEHLQPASVQVPVGHHGGCGPSQESAPALQELGRAYQMQCSHSEQKPESNRVSCSLWIKRPLSSCLLEETSPDQSVAISPSWLAVSWRHPCKQMWPYSVL